MTGIRLPGLGGQLFVVTGAAGGQGAAEALLLAENGAQVLALDVHDAAPELLAAATGLPGTIEYRRLDVNQWQLRFIGRSASEVCDQIERFGAEVWPLVMS